MAAKAVKSTDDHLAEAMCACYEKNRDLLTPQERISFSLALATANNPKSAPPEQPPPEYIVLAHDQRPCNPVYQWYVVNGLTSCAERSSSMFLNLPTEALKAAVRCSLAELREPVWFACDVGQHMDSDRSLLVSGLHPC
eukprot:g5778.t1